VFKFKCTYPGCKFKGTPRKDYLLKHMKTCHDVSKDRSDKKSLMTYYNEAKAREAISARSERDLRLLEAVARGEETLVQDLLSAGAEVGVKDSKSRSTFHLALEKGHDAVLRLLLTKAEKAMPPEEIVELKQLLLFQAVSNGEAKTVRMLLANGASARHLLQESHEIAMGDERDAILGFLLEKMKKEASSEQITNVLQSLLDDAISSGRKKLVRTMLYHGASSRTRKEFDSAVASGDEELLGILLANANTTTSFESITGPRETLLYEAIDTGNEALVGTILEFGASANLVHRWSFGRRTALHKATERGYEAIVKLLLENGADVRAKSSLDETALEIADRSGHTNIKRLLLEHETQSTRSALAGAKTLRGSERSSLLYSNFPEHFQ
jgi:ankyrin repeat protein